MCFAAAEALAGYAGKNLTYEHLLPRMTDKDIYPLQAAAVGMKALEQGLASQKASYAGLLEHAKKVIKRAQEATQVLMNSGIIPERVK